MPDPTTYPKVTYPEATPIYWAVARHYSLDTNIGLLCDFIDANDRILSPFKGSAKDFVQKRTTRIWEENGWPLPRPEPEPDPWAPDDSTPYQPVASLSHVNTQLRLNTQLTPEEKETFRGD